MDFRIHGENLVGAEWQLVSDIEVKPGEILLAPRSNRLYEPSITPLDNLKTWPSWRRNAGGGFKACQGTSDYLSLGGTFRLPAPVRFRPDPMSTNWEARWDIGGGAWEVDPWGPLLQLDHFPYDASGEACPMNHGRSLPESSQPKLVNPWMIKTAPGWSTLLLPCLYEATRDWTLLPGVVNTDYYHHMNWVINVYTDEEFVLPLGTPIGQFLTFPRDHQQILYGETRIAQLLINLGLKSPIALPIVRKGVYRAHQKESPKAEVCPVSELTVSPWKRIYYWLFGEFNPPKDQS
jgi:hypothetical protein